MKVYYNFIFYLFSNNFLILRLYFKKIVNIDYENDFSNLCFYDQKKIKKILVNNKKKFSKNEDDFFIYHSFNWIKEAKNVGGSNMVKIARNKILQWIENDHKFYFYLTNNDLTAKRVLNLINHFDFYGSSADEKDKNKIKFLIFCHYSFLKKYLKKDQNSSLELIEIKKSVLLFEAIHNIDLKKIIEQIKKSLNEDVNYHGLHFSMSPQIQAEYINHLIEIKNIFLYFKIDSTKELDFKIVNMTSVLKNFIHKDNSVAYFNGSNNFYSKQVFKIIENEKDINIKNINDNKNCLVAYENKDIKIIFDAVYPYNKLINYGFHASTLSFELSYMNEKIITNCGSINKTNNKMPNYFRYSAAHSSIILNNTNISELIENKSYKRIPKNINFEKKENENELIWEASHDGYKINFRKIIKRKIIIDKNNNEIKGKDEIIALGLKKRNNVFNIRFHLTPICKALLTRGKMSAIIKTNNSSFLFTSDNKINLEESIFVNSENKTVKTSQIVISGSCNDQKKIINWSILKH
jgi:uncharacterized heparinase superfamily protein